MSLGKQAGVFVLLHVWWVISVYVSRGREDVPQDADPIEMIKGTNWYCYNVSPGPAGLGNRPV